jgi:hypothetical protein
MATEKIKLQPFIHSSWSYLLTTLHVWEPSLVAGNVKTLQDMVAEVSKGAQANYPQALPSDLKHSLRGVDYALARLAELCTTAKSAEDDEFSVFADVISFRFQSLEELLKFEDAD